MISWFRLTDPWKFEERRRRLRSSISQACLSTTRIVSSRPQKYHHFIQPLQMSSRLSEIDVLGLRSYSSPSIVITRGSHARYRQILQLPSQFPNSWKVEVYLIFTISQACLPTTRILRLAVVNVTTLQSKSLATQDRCLWTGKLHVINARV